MSIKVKNTMNPLAAGDRGPLECWRSDTLGHQAKPLERKVPPRAQSDLGSSRKQPGAFEPRKERITRVHKVAICRAFVA
jgi:hypothetical protein